MKWLSEEEWQEALRLTRAAGIADDTCPTCGNKREMGEWNESDCNCDTQLKLYHRYLLAHIPEEYMRLDWKTEFNGDPKVIQAVESYLARWDTAKKLGMGIEFHGASLGVGKTFGATYIGKELIKRGETVHFERFNTLISAFVNKTETILEPALNSKVLILDEVQLPFSSKGLDYISHSFEEMARERTSQNRPTIVTTNLSQQQIEEAFPRVFSLFSAKQVPIEMVGQDARQSHIATRNMELLMNQETPPIS